MGATPIGRKSQMHQQGTSAAHGCLPARRVHGHSEPEGASIQGKTMPRRNYVRLLTLVLAAALGMGALTGCSSGSSAAEHVAKAKAFQSEGKLKAAIIELKNALQQEPDLAEARWLLGNDYLQLDDGQSALKELSRARTLGFNAPELPLAIARALILAGKYQEALVEVAGIPLGQDQATVLALTGRAQLGLHEIDKARDAFEEALKQDPKQADAHLGLATIAAAQSKLDDAGAQIDQVLADHPGHMRAALMKGEIDLARGKTAEAESAFQGVLKGAGDTVDITAHLGMARSLIAQNRLDEAAAHIQTVLKVSPNQPLANYLSAVVAYQRHDLKAAQDDLREVLRVTPDHLPSMLLMGTINYAQGQLEQAEDMLSRYVKAVPKHVPARKLLGALRLTRRQPERALEALLPVESQAGDDPQYLALLGTAYLREGDTAKATEYLKRANDLAPDVAAIRTQLAVSHLASGDTDEAVSELETAVDLGQDQDQADVLLVLTHLRQGEFDKALAAAAKLAERKPNSAVAHNLMAAAHLGKGDIAKARAEFEAALKAQPDFVPAALNLAQMDLKEKKPDDARKHLESILEQSPQNSQALVALARLASSQGKEREALDLLEKARSGNDSALEPRLILGNYYLRKGQRSLATEVEEEARKIAPDAPAALMLLGEVQLANGQASQAIDTFHRLIKSNPRNPKLYERLAAAQALTGQTEQARQSYEKALAIADDKDPAALLGLGRLELASGRLDQVHTLAARLEKLLPDSAAGFILEGDGLMAAGQDQQAIKVFETAAQHGPSAEVALKLSAARAQAGDAAGGRKTLRSWLDKHPEDGRVRLALASYYQSAGDTEAATKEYQALLKQFPNDPVALNNLAWMYHENGKPEALDLAERALKAAPDNAAIMDTLGWLRVQAGQSEQGIRLLEKAVDKAPHVPDIRYHLAVGLSQSGDKERARSELKTALESKAAFPSRKDAEALLGDLH